MFSLDDLFFGLNIVVVNTTKKGREDNGHCEHAKSDRGVLFEISKDCIRFI